jgi:serine phosphatase RsbU (regulator of sigma subunit)
LRAQRATAGHRRRTARTRAGGHKLTTAGTSTEGLASGLGSSASLAAVAQRKGTARPGSRSALARATTASSAPIVQTITRIVGVVPTAVWIALGALLALAAALAAGSRLLALRARRLERQRGELLADVGLLQTALLPVPPAGRGALSSTVAYRPADGPAAGGDLYDVFSLPDGSVATIVGDVSGHGRAALPHTALVRYTLRAYLEAGLSPREALQTAGAVLERQLDGALATALLASYRPRERTLVYACAGHPPPLVLGTRSRLDPVAACSAPPIGAGLRTGTRQTVLSLPGAAWVCMHTDGVTDARVGGELYGSERLEQALRSLGPQGAAQALLDRVAEQTDERPDDMAACLLTLRGDAAQPATMVQELELVRGTATRERTERFLLACGMEVAAAGRVADEACMEVERAGSVLLEVRISAQQSTATLRRDDVPDIHASDTRLLATVGARR